MTDDPRAIAGKLAYKQYQTMLALSATPRRAITFSGNCSRDLMKPNSRHGVLVAVEKRDGNAFYYLTPLGLKVRQILQEEASQ